MECVTPLERGIGRVQYRPARRFADVGGARLAIINRHRAARSANASTVAKLTSVAGVRVGAGGAHRAGPAADASPGSASVEAGTRVSVIAETIVVQAGASASAAGSAGTAPERSGSRRRPIMRVRDVRLDAFVEGAVDEYAVPCDVARLHRPLRNLFWSWSHPEGGRSGWLLARGRAVRLATFEDDPVERDESAECVGCVRRPSRWRAAGSP